MFPDGKSPCHLTDDDKAMWKLLKGAKQKTMIDIGTNVGLAENRLWPYLWDSSKGHQEIPFRVTEYISL